MNQERNPTLPEGESTALNGLTYGQKLDKRVQILQEHMQKTNYLCDQMRNLRDIELANENDPEVKKGLSIKYTHIQQ